MASGTDPSESHVAAWFRPNRRRGVVVALAIGLAVLPIVGVVVTGWIRQIDGFFARREIFAVLTRSPYRAVESRLSYPSVADHRPAGTAGRIPGGGDPPLLSMEALGRLERAGDSHGVAVANLMAGEMAQARVRLDLLLKDETTRTPPVLNDRAAVALAEGDPAGALELLDEILDRDELHGPALFNRAVALRALRLPLGAADLFERVARLGESGWGSEARAEASRLRTENDSRMAHWKAGQEVQDQMSKTGLPPEPKLAAQQPESAREGLYEALWTATEPAMVERLLPLARTLDAHFGGQSLTRVCEEVIRGNFAKRLPLSERHAAYRRQQLRGDELVTFALQHKGEPAVRDQVIGALAITGLVKDHLDTFAVLAAPYDDPWLETVEQEGRWALAYGARRYDEAARVAAAGLAGCGRVPLHRRCVMYETRLAQALSALYRLTEAQSHLRHARDTAIGRGLLLQESMLAATAGKLEFRRFRNALGRAFLEEVGLNDQSRCIDQADAHEKLAEYALWRGRVAAAAAELARVKPCPRRRPTTLTALGISVASGLRRFGAHLVNKDQVEAAILDLARLDGPESRGLNRLLAGRWRLHDDESVGRRLLGEALANAPTANAVDRPYVESEAGAALAFEAGRRGAWGESLEWLRGAADVAMPSGCVLGVAVDSRAGAGDRPPGAW